MRDSRCKKGAKKEDNGSISISVKKNTFQTIGTLKHISGETHRNSEKLEDCSLNILLYLNPQGLIIVTKGKNI